MDINFNSKVEDDDDDLACLIGHMDEEERKEEEEVAKKQHPQQQQSRVISSSSSATLVSSKTSFMNQQKSTTFPSSSNVLKETVKVPQRVINGPRRLRHAGLKYFKGDGIDQTENRLFDLTVTERVISQERVAAIFGEERPMIRLKALSEVDEGEVEEFEKPFGTVAVVARVGETQTSVKTKLPFRIWRISDLRGTEINLMLFGEAYKLISSKVNPGSVVILTDMKLVYRAWEDRSGIRRFEQSLSVNKETQIIRVGISPVFAICRIRECAVACDTSISPYCAEHARLQLKIVATNRMALNSAGGAFSLENGAIGRSVPRSAKEARQHIAGLRSHNNNLNDEDLDENAIRTSSAQREMENIPVKKVDAKAFISEVMANKKNLSAAQLKVAQALKMAQEAKPKPSYIPPAPLVVIPNCTTNETYRPSVIRPLGSGLALQAKKLDKILNPKPTTRKTPAKKSKSANDQENQALKRAFRKAFPQIDTE